MNLHQQNLFIIYTTLQLPVTFCQTKLHSWTQEPPKTKLSVISSIVPRPLSCSRGTTSTKEENDTLDHWKHHNLSKNNQSNLNLRNKDCHHLQTFQHSTISNKLNIITSVLISAIHHPHQIKQPKCSTHNTFICSFHHLQNFQQDLNFSLLPC